jgi:hypothetical protein
MISILCSFGCVDVALFDADVGMGSLSMNSAVVLISLFPVAAFVIALWDSMTPWWEDMQCRRLG